MIDFCNNTFTFRIFLVFLFFLFGKNGIAQTSITGKIINEETKEELIDAEIILYKNGNLIRNTRTDSKGNYKLNIDPGSYVIDFFCRGFTTQRVVEVLGIEGQQTKLNLQL
ncbi:MAG: carboxypeptidase-like regulatory domain-containing protein [Saprospiraceae bacterium]